MKRTRLRVLGVAVASLALVASMAGSALAFDSGGNPGGPGDNTITWTGQGAKDGVLNTEECPSEDVVPDGIDPDSYLHWIFTTDGGSVSGTPELTLGGTGSGSFDGTNSGGAWHFFTPYFTPDSNLLADVAFTAATAGNGAWILTISHGCSGTSVPDAAPPTVTKVAAGAYDNTYTWKIDKSVDKTKVNQVGGSATFNYTVEVEHDAGTVSNVTVSGTITVNNPNGSDVELTSISDVLSDLTECDVTGDLTLSPGDNVFTYTCDLGDALPDDYAELTNKVTITWDDQTLDNDAFLAAGTDDFTTGVIDFTGTDIDECVDVTDTYAGALGTACVGDANPKSFTYSRVIPVPAYGCKTYDNTATFTTNDTETTGSDSQTVEVCGPAKTGALTMGFWQNPNGQNIIGSYSGTNCQTLLTWLKQYNPYNNAVAANCTAVKKYVTDIIKAANASGSSMNAMLKAQMLATALDVYFSDPALGGNRIGAPAPIGGFSVDLTMICTDMTCTSFEDSSSVFGGSPKTVLQMLSYASSQSNVGGTSWYGQVKATQELAKDAFDAINNEKVFPGA